MTKLGSISANWKPRCSRLSDCFLWRPTATRNRRKKIEKEIKAWRSIKLILLTTDSHCGLERVSASPESLPGLVPASPKYWTPCPPPPPPPPPGFIAWHCLVAEEKLFESFFLFFFFFFFFFFFLSFFVRSIQSKIRILKFLEHL